MSGLNLQERNRNVVQVVNGSRVQSEDLLAAATTVTGSVVNLLPGECEDGLVLRWTIAGSKSATNGTWTAILYADATALCTCTSDASTAVDWRVEFICYCGGGKLQKVSGVLLMDTEDPDVQYDAGAVNLQAGATLKVVVTGTSGDTVDAEFCIVERLVVA